MNKYHIKIPIYTSRMELIVNCPEQEALDYWNKKYGLSMSETGYAGFHQQIRKGDGSAHLVWVELFDWSITAQSFLAHELIHTTFSILDDVSVKFDIENHEAFAYLYDYLFEQCWRKLGSLHPKKKKSKKFNNKKDE